MMVHHLWPRTLMKICWCVGTCCGSDIISSNTKFRSESGIGLTRVLWNSLIAFWISSLGSCLITYPQQPSSESSTILSRWMLATPSLTQAGKNSTPSSTTSDALRAAAPIMAGITPTHRLRMVVGIMKNSGSCSACLSRISVIARFPVSSESSVFLTYKTSSPSLAM